MSSASRYVEPEFGACALITIDVQRDVRFLVPGERGSEIAGELLPSPASSSTTRHTSPERFRRSARARW